MIPTVGEYPIAKPQNDKGPDQLLRWCPASLWLKFRLHTGRKEDQFLRYALQRWVKGRIGMKEKDSFLTTGRFRCHRSPATKTRSGIFVILKAGLLGNIAANALYQIEVNHVSLCYPLMQKWVRELLTILLICLLLFFLFWRRIRGSGETSDATIHALWCWGKFLYYFLGVL